jgi:hypothetical protein
MNHKSIKKPLSPPKWNYVDFPNLYCGLTQYRYEDATVNSNFVKSNIKSAKLEL